MRIRLHIFRSLVMDKPQLSESISSKIDFVKEEERVLELWKKINAFETSIRLSEGRKSFSFFDGPPFATGLPHYGHVLAGTVKDIVTRFAYQTGHRVERRFGWDCHGLPIEHEIDKSYSIKTPADVEKIGIAKYNELCRGIVMRFAGEWETIVSRFGRWIDFKNDYKTMYPEYMESVWWVFKQLWDRDLVYRSFRVMPYSTACTTPLSNFETSQNFKETTDPSIVIKFPVLNHENIGNYQNLISQPKNDIQTSENSANIQCFLLAWTTTPWTLPSHMCLVVNPNHVYVRIVEKSSKFHYILMKNRVNFMFKPDSYTILDTFQGKTLKGVRYIPPFDYYREKYSDAFVVCIDPFVTDDSGTGIVHSAPAFGQDDLRVCVDNGFLKNESPPCPIDVAGFFKDPVTEYCGMYFKEADSVIIKDLKAKGRIFKHETHAHSYPFCWRSDTPIMYRAVPSWFIKVESFVEKLLDNNKKSRWVPEYVRSKRFHNWLEATRDWNVSRNRYWGTPIPIWVSDDMEETICVGSIDELYRLSGVRVTDLHREHIDHIQIPSQKGKGFLKRTSEVFDCWFESGSMPYAQIHYPFENKDRFSEYFPADFVAEGIDQTRGWFYTLLVISTALFNETPFKNVIVSGLVLASSGEKMSKRKKNYPDVNEMVNKYGADCIRCYLMNSPAVNGENLCFKESGLSDLTKELFLPWFNAFRFFDQYKTVYESVKNEIFKFEENNITRLESLVDEWMLSYAQSFVKKFRFEMSNYKLYNVLPNIQAFIDTLTKWYIRINRQNLKGDSGNHLQSLSVLYHCLLNFCITVAPVCPFICEYYFQNLKKYLNFDKNDESYNSVHFRMIPEVDDRFINLSLEANFQNFRSVVDLARKIRERNNLPMKHPLSRLVIIHPDSKFLENLKQLEIFVLEDLNIKEVIYTHDHALYNLQLTVVPNFKLLGKRLGKDLKNVMEEINSYSEDKLLECLRNGQIEAKGYEISSEEIKVCFKTCPGEIKGGKFDANTFRELAVLLDIIPDPKLEDEGVARDFVNRVQRLRKQAKLNPVEDIQIFYSIEEAKKGDADLIRALENNYAVIQNIIKKPINRVEKGHVISSSHLIMKENFELMDAMISLSLVRSNKD